MSQPQSDDKPIFIREASSTTADMVAGIRARYEDTPEAKALVNLTGTVISNIFHVLAPKPLGNISVVRDLTSNHLVESHLPEDGQERIFVDLACGYSSRGAVLARLRPDVQVYEIDLPNVIEEKLKRYSRRGIAMPANHHMVRADMKTSSLSDLLDGNKADVVMARGLFIYFDMDAVKQAARNIMSGLKPGGHLICDLGLGTAEAIGTFSAVINFVRKQTNSDASRGRVDTIEEGESLFREVGFATVKGYRFSDFEDTLDLPQPYTDMMLLVDAQTASEKSTAKPAAKSKSAAKPADTSKTVEKSTASDNIQTEPMKPDLMPTAAQEDESPQASTETPTAEATVEEELAVEDTAKEETPAEDTQDKPDADEDKSE